MLHSAVQKPPFFGYDASFTPQENERRMGMLHVLILAIISFAISYFYFTRYRGQFTVNEFVLMQVVTVTVAIGGYFLVQHASLQSVEHWNGRLVRKYEGTQHCCHCTDVCKTCTDSKGKSYSCDCHEVCDHFSDYWWKLDVSTGDTITVRDCASSAAYVPDDWTNARVGEAASVAHRYTNYLKASPDSILRHQGSPYASLIPEFPGIHGTYKTDKVIGADNVPIPPGWQEALRELNADIGRDKQVDIAVLLTKSTDPRYAEGVEESWLYGPKNALIVVMGVSENAVIWARVVTISKVEELKIKLRDNLPTRKLNDTTVIAFIGEAVKEGFTRTPMDEFKYLASDATPSTGWLIFLYLFHIAASFALAWYFVNNRHTEGFQFSPPPASRRIGRRLTTFEPLSDDNPDLRPGALLGRRWPRK